LKKCSPSTRGIRATIPRILHLYGNQRGGSDVQSKKKAFPKVITF
jgi:hypothetical protein